MGQKHGATSTFWFASEGFEVGPTSQASNEGVKLISEIMEDFHENGILLAMFFFALPVAVPLPYPPGFTTIMGVSRQAFFITYGPVWIPSQV